MIPRRERPAWALLAAGATLCLLGIVPVEAARRDHRGEGVEFTKSATASANVAAGSARRGPGRLQAPRTRRQRFEAAGVMIFTAPGHVAVGETLTMTVRLNGGRRAGHHASLSLGVDPSILEYQGFAPTGRGALLVQPYPDQAGVLTLYRSSLPEGFSPAEDLATLTFRVKGPGRAIVSLSDVRLLDGRARDMPVTFEAGEVYVE